MLCTSPYWCLLGSCEGSCICDCSSSKILLNFSGETQRCFLSGYWSRQGTRNNPISLVSQKDYNVSFRICLGYVHFRMGSCTLEIFIRSMLCSYLFLTAEKNLNPRYEICSWVDIIIGPSLLECLTLWLWKYHSLVQLNVLELKYFVLRLKPLDCQSQIIFGFQRQNSLLLWRLRHASCVLILILCIWWDQKIGLFGK